MLNNWLFYVILYLISSVIFNQCYKISTNSMKRAGALTVLIELLAGIFSLFIIPFFPLNFPKDPKVYFFLGLAVIFYAIQDRLATTARSGLDASAYSILKQLSTVFMIILGLLFFKETFIWNKILGAILIVISNILVFYKKSLLKLDRYIILGIIANLCLTVALFFDVNFSKQFNLAIYVAVTLLFPTLLIWFFEKIRIKDIIQEYKSNNRIIIFITSISWSLMMIVKLKAYQLGKVTLVAPLCSLAVIVNILVSYFLLNEKDDLIKKVIAGILIIISIILIKI